jgi:hypothetical protein
MSEHVPGTSAAFDVGNTQIGVLLSIAGLGGN